MSLSPNFLSYILVDRISQLFEVFNINHQKFCHFNNFVASLESRTVNTIPDLMSSIAPSVYLGTSQQQRTTYSAARFRRRRTFQRLNLQRVGCQIHPATRRKLETTHFVKPQKLSSKKTGDNIPTHHTVLAHDVCIEFLSNNCQKNLCLIHIFFKMVKKY